MLSLLALLIMIIAHHYWDPCHSMARRYLQQRVSWNEASISIRASPNGLN